MLLMDIPAVMSREEVAQAQALMAGAGFVDGRATGAKVGRGVKQNQQIDGRGEDAKKLLVLVRDALLRREVFTGAVFPQKMHLNFNRYETGMYYGRHNDAAIVGPNMVEAVRTDVSFTVFLADPGEYDGGELVIYSDRGEEEIKLPAGDAIVYEGSTVHEVKPITRGARLACFGWAQSFVADPQQRDLLARFRRMRLGVLQDQPEAPFVDELGNIYNNLMRMWSTP